MICLMHEGDPYGHLLINGNAPTDGVLARQVGATLREVRAGLRELAATDVYPVTDNEVIFSRRMVRDANRAAANKANGLKGGNPVLMDQPSVNGSVGDSVNRSLNPQIPEARSQKPETRSQKRAVRGSAVAPPDTG